MANTPHELSEEFPDRVEDIARLKAADAHFAKMVDDYHTLNRAVHRAETLIEPTDSVNEQEMRRQRVLLKDQIARALASQQA